ncbi:MAG TPA: serine/threonine-protein kinase [Kofleriaceae bacterium]|nr:serine/threonine-protein kinase [Kofleriaceae bacterium]
MVSSADDQTVPTPATETGGGSMPRFGSGSAPGGTMGRFVILGVLGSGGMGIVLSAFDPELDRKVAIKVLHTSGAGVESRAYLQREAQAMAKLSHPNAVTVYEVGRAADHLFIAMELVEGTTLKAWLAAEPRTWREVLAMFVAAGNGLVAAHEAGLVHRDFKPENVLIGKDGRPRVSDFGLAESGGADPDVIGGTPIFMSPEQWQHAEVDARSDQFAFCVALWLALFGETPFEGFTPAELKEAVVAGRRRARGGAAGERDVPGWLVSIIERGFAVDPDARWPSIAALLAEIDRRASARRRAWLAAGGIALVVASGGGAVAAMNMRSTHVDPCPVPTARVEAVWGPARQTSLRAHLEAIDPQNGAARFTAAAAAFDRAAPAWRDMQLATCRASKVENRQSDTIFDARMACLDKWLTGLGGAVSGLEGASDADSLEGAIKGIGGIAPIERCADVDALLAAEQLPEDPAARAEAKAIVADASTINDERRAGKTDGLAARMDAVVARARTLGHPTTLSKALAVQWRLLVTSGDIAGGLAVLREVTEVSARAGDDTEAANTWALMGRLTAQFQGQPDEARVMMLAARAAAARAGDPPLLRAEVLGNEADVLNAAGDAAGAAADLDIARGLLVAAGADEPGSPVAPRLAGLLQSVGESHWFAKRYDDAIAAHREAIAIFDRAYGPDTYDAAGVYLDLAQVLRDARRLPEAAAAVEPSLRVRTRRNPEGGDVAIALSVKASILSFQGRHDEAVAAARRSVDIGAASMPPEDGQLITLRGTLAEVLADAGKEREALALLGEIVAAADRAGVESRNVVHWRALRDHLKQRARPPP